MSDNKAILSLRGITKTYPGVTALDDFDWDLIPGEVHALVGENGAGKSTLIKIITGAIEPTSGTIHYLGKPYHRMDPIHAIHIGIGAVYQEFNLVPYLTVAENIFFGREIRKGMMLDVAEMCRQTEQILKRLKINIDPMTRVKDLSVAYQQIVEIAKSVSRDVKLLILDEPSAPLTKSEIDAMFGIVRELKRQGVTIIYISHRLEEIFELSDRVTVMRDSKFILTMYTKDTDRSCLIQLMVGRDLAESYLNHNRRLPDHDPVLEVKELSNHFVQEISFQLHRGEILGIAGLVGAGRTELARALFAADPTSHGEVKLHGKKVCFKNPADAIRAGIGLIPEDRKQHGVLLGLSIQNNASLSALRQLSKWGWLFKSKEKALVTRLKEELQIKTPSLDQLVKNLSGGNQQKVVLAKWMATKCGILIFDEPTRGIDVGAKHEIYKLMRQLVEEGKSIIMISSEMPELIGMSDRILVMHEGSIAGELSWQHATQEKILDMASGE